MNGNQLALICAGVFGAVLLTPLPRSSGSVGQASRAAEPGSDTQLPKASEASPTLTRPLDSQQYEELYHGMVELVHDHYARALPILGKYALMGDVHAQQSLGAIYYSGLGLSPNRDEAIRWLRLAAAQGGQAERDSLAAAIDGTMQWDRTSNQPAHAANTPVPVPQSDWNIPPSPAIDAYSASVLNQVNQQKAIAMAAQAGSMSRGPASADVGHASDRYMVPLPSLPVPPIPEQPRTALLFSNPVTLNRAGGNQYSGSDGDSYTQAGPHGVTNNRTGQFTPTN